MDDLVGLTSIALVCCVIIILGLKWPKVSKIIYVALAVRVLFILIGHYIIPLPDSTKDAAGLEELAWSYAQNGFFYALNQFTGINSFFYSWSIGVLYSIFGRSILLAQSVSLFFGVSSIFLACFIAEKIWDNYTAIKVGWVLALFPSLILYSILPLREVYQSFFLLVAFIGIFYWTKIGGYKYFFLAIFGFIGASFFHGALFLGGIIFLMIVVLMNIKKIFFSIINLRLNLQAFIIVTFVIIILQFYILNKIYIPKIGYFKDLNLGFVFSELSARMIGDASYGEWAQINSLKELIYKSPLRVIYFLFSPFPWHVTKPTHLIGMLDGFLYMIIFYLIFYNLKIIWKDTFLRITLIILIFYLILFGLGVGNFGSGLRHRSKFIIEMILLAGPLIPNILFSKKNAYKKKLNNKNFKKS